MEARGTERKEEGSRGYSGWWKPEFDGRGEAAGLRKGYCEIRILNLNMSLRINESAEV